MQNKIKILVFTPYAYFSGSELLMYYLINSLDPNEFEVQLVSLRDGELLKKLNVPKYYINQFPRFGRVKSKLISIFGKGSILEKKVNKIHNSFKPDLWYLNTCRLSNIAKIAVQKNIPYAVHFHEMPFAYQTENLNSFKKMVTNAKCLVGCSKAVTNALDNMKVKNQRLELLYSYIDMNRISVNEQRIQQLKKELSIEENCFVWICSGAVCYNKGIDFVIDILDNLREEKIKIIWLGRVSQTGLTYYINKTLEKKDLSKKIHFTGVKFDDYYDYFSLANGFLLLSRNDSFPQVMIEAASLGKPIVAFNSGGVKEFIQPGMGKIIEKYNMPQFIQTMNDVMRGSLKISTETLKSRAEMFDVKGNVAKWKKIIQEVVHD